MTRAELQEIENLFKMPAWRDTLEHVLRARLSSDLDALADSSIARKESDDFLRGRIWVLRYLLIVLPEKLSAAKAEDEAPAAPEAVSFGNPYEERL